MINFVSRLDVAHFFYFRLLFCLLPYSWKADAFYVFFASLDLFSYFIKLITVWIELTQSLGNFLPDYHLQIRSARMRSYVIRLALQRWMMIARITKVTRLIGLLRTITNKLSCLYAQCVVLTAMFLIVLSILLHTFLFIFCNYLFFNLVCAAKKCEAEIGLFLLSIVLFCYLIIFVFNCWSQSVKQVCLEVWWRL